MGYLIWIMIGIILLSLGLIITFMRADRLNPGNSAVSEKINGWIVKLLIIAISSFVSFALLMSIGKYIFLKDSTPIHSFRDGELYEEDGEYFILETNFFHIDEPLKKKWIEIDLTEDEIKVIETIRELETYALYVEK